MEFELGFKVNSGPKGTTDSSLSIRNQEEQMPRDGERHRTFGDLLVCRSRRKCVSLEGKEGGSGGGI